MKTVGVLFLGVLALTASQGCRQKNPEPIPGPKAGRTAAVHFHPAGIAWFQGNFEEAFAPPPHDRVDVAAARSRAKVRSDMATRARVDISSDQTTSGPADAQGDVMASTRTDTHGNVTASARARLPGNAAMSAQANTNSKLATSTQVDGHDDAMATARAGTHGEAAVTARADTRQPRAQSTCPLHREHSTKGTVVCRSC